METVYFLWNGVHGKATVDTKERDGLLAEGYIEVEGFEADRILPTAAEVEKQAAKYQTKVMTADTGKAAKKKTPKKNTKA